MLLSVTTRLSHRLCTATALLVPAIGLALATLPTRSCAQTITWSSISNAINSTSTHSSNMAGFRFELGVFSNGFTPTENNIDEWATHWNPAQAVFYNPSTKRFAGKFTVTHNISPFLPGTAAYIWGFNGSPQEAEWILFRNNTWLWPQASTVPVPVSNNSLSWVAEFADAVFTGDIQNSGNPYLMKTASITNKRPPSTPWHVWIQQELLGVPNNGPNDDSDNDGASNLLEFVMGSQPKQGGGIPSSKASVVQVNSNKYLQILVPRRIDHTANLTVQVADHPAGPWLSGPEHTTLVSDDITGLTVRDNIPISPEKPQRFMRLHAELP